MVFVLLAQFVLVNVVVAVLMKHLEETHKQVVLFNDVFLKIQWFRSNLRICSLFNVSIWCFFNLKKDC